jgi:hypothetical protein
MAFRALRLVRDTAAFADVPRTPSADAAPYVRDASGALMDAIRTAYGNKVSRANALRVPALARAYKLYTGTISCFPLADYGPDGARVPNPFLDRPAALTTYTALVARTVGDLILTDVAWWRIVSRDWRGYPTAVEHMPADQVSVSPTNTDDAAADLELGAVSWNGTRIPAPQVIRFDGDGTGGWLTTGVDAITTAAALEATVLRTAEVPAPSIILKNTGADLPPEQVDALLDAWEAARANRTTAYMNATIEADSLTGWSPNDLQLVEARNAAATMVGRLCNLDPVWVGAGVPGSSLTYTNRQDLYRQLLDLSLQPVMRQITDRLSMEDVTPRGHTVKFDTDTFLRADTATLTALISQLVPLGVLSAEQGAQLLDLPTPTESTE